VIVVVRRHAMHAVILERNKLVGRRVARLFAATGATTVTIDDPALLVASLQDADVLCADAFDGDLVAEQVRAQAWRCGILWTAEPAPRAQVPPGRDAEHQPRASPRLRLAAAPVGSRDAPRAGSHRPPPATLRCSAFLDWGATTLELDIRSTRDRDVAVAQIQEFVAALAVPRRVAEMFGELGHELIMNAMYDAPIDAHGRPKYANDRKAEIVLDDVERPIVRLGTDGTRLVLQVRDPFGRLERRHVVDGLARGLAGEMDQSHGGAGLGMMVCHNASSAMFFDVSRGRHTEVTAVFELDMNLREFRTSEVVHFWSR
jgi:hypothetical protein